MNPVFILFSLLLTMPLYALAQGPPIQFALPGSSTVTLKPDLDAATLNEGYGKLPFTVRNNSPIAIDVLPYYRGVVTLMTTNDLGQPVTIEYYRNPSPIPVSAVGSFPIPIRLKPAESRTFDAGFSMDTMAFVASKKRKTFGEVSVQSTDDDRSFVVRSDSFVVPDKLTKPPWKDLGKQTYLAITVDATKSYRSGEVLLFPIKIKNTTSQSLIVNSEDASFLRNEADRKSGPEYWEPNLWELFEGPNPTDHFCDVTLLKPGETVEAGHRTYMYIPNDPNKWKEGDTRIIGVAGRIPGTNKAFESYSAPFQLPKYPYGQPPDLDRSANELPLIVKVQLATHPHRRTTSGYLGLASQPAAAIPLRGGGSGLV